MLIFTSSLDAAAVFVDEVSVAAVVVFFAVVFAVVPSVLLLPHAQRVRAMESARKSAVMLFFFMFILSAFFLLLVLEIFALIAAAFAYR